MFKKFKQIVCVIFGHKLILSSPKDAAKNWTGIHCIRCGEYSQEAGALKHIRIVLYELTSDVKDLKRKIGKLNEALTDKPSSEEEKTRATVIVKTKSDLQKKEEWAKAFANDLDEERNIVGQEVSELWESPKGKALLELQSNLKQLKVDDLIKREKGLSASWDEISKLKKSEEACVKFLAKQSQINI
jgi:NADH dehydrogenase/NADH:ubiquinone oxidoreductase subunit G